jgi:DNA-binding Lrp family transcriptional regulator
LKREAAKIETVTYRIFRVSSQTDKMLSEMQELRKRINLFEQELPKLYIKNSDNEEVKEIHERIKKLEKRVRDIITSQDATNTKISNIESQTQLFLTSDKQPKSVIPIRRDKALAPLTPTEMLVLELLMNEGSQTSNQVKQRIKLSREHTARLMKKLFEEGYLERDTVGLPFRYHLKKEMEELLNSTERA